MNRFLAKSVSSVLLGGLLWAVTVPAWAVPRQLVLPVGTSGSARTAAITYTWDDAWLDSEHSGYSYNHGLARVAGAIMSTVYLQPQGALTDLLSVLGCGRETVRDYHYAAVEPEFPHKSGYSFAWRQMENGEALVFVAIRGTNGRQEWLSNLNIADATRKKQRYHEGFERSAMLVLHDLALYIEEQGLADELRFQGSICGDGPYDLVTTIRYYLEDDGTSYDVQTEHRKGKLSYPVVAPLIVKGMHATHPAMAPYELKDFLSEQFLDTGVIDWTDSKDYNTTELAQMWYNQVQNGVDTLGHHYTPEQMAELFDTPSSNKVIGNIDKMFTQELYDYMSDDSNFDVVPEVPVNAPQALHRAIYDNSLSTGWEPQHRIQFYHSKYDMVVPYGNYLAFRDGHLQSEGTMYRVDDTFSESDHVMAGGAFMVYVFVSKSVPQVFNWICEGSQPTGITEMSDARGKMSEVWFSLDGRRLYRKPMQKGVYINNGVKFVVE